MWSPARNQQERVAARVRDLLGEKPSVGGSHRRPEFDAAPQRWGWEPSRTVLAGAAVLVVAVVLVTFWWYESSQSAPVPVISNRSSSSNSPATVTAPARSASGAPATEIVVDVAGKVVHPGVYHLQPGARVDDAVRAAGGAVAGVSTVSLNLAAPLHDGDEVVVGIPGAGPAAPAAPAGGSGAATSGPLDLNSATAAQLDALPGVGPVLAQHIIDWRTAHGGFTSVNQLQQVSGIGDSKFSDLKSLVAA